MGVTTPSNSACGGCIERADCCIIISDPLVLCLEEEMANPDRTPISEQIAWQFVISEQMHSTRYGTHHGRFWKQYLPGGAIINGRFPPKVITQEHYELAERHKTD